METAMRLSLRCLWFTSFFLLANVAYAGITGTGGAVTVVASPQADISSNQWESDTQIRAFAEQTNLILSQDVADDISVPGTSPSASSNNLSPATIPAGTAVNSYFLHFDVVGQRATANALEATGSISFAEPVVGILALSDTLNTSNSFFALAGVTYASGADHGLDFDPAGDGTSDIVTLTADRRTVAVDLRNASFADDLRIVTAVPEPACISLCMMILLAAARPKRMIRLVHG
jgi:hypothetical protein